jgi:hypothetical protein
MRPFAYQGIGRDIVAKLGEFLRAMRTKIQIARYQRRQVRDEIAVRDAREHAERQKAGIKDVMPPNNPGAAG